MIDTGQFSNFSKSIKVDNQLGTLHDAIQKYLPYEEIRCEPFNIQYDNELEIYKCENAIPIDLATEVRTFINNIKFDLSKPHLNDTDNFPQFSVLNEAISVKPISLSYSETPSDWTWENYATWGEQSIWRLLPKNLNAFVNSPIKRLIDLVETKWATTVIPEIDMLLLRKITWVIQLIPSGYNIGWHNDKCVGRIISFIYYLTDNWDRVDGGALQIKKDNKITNINPTFNSLLMWHMKNNEGPLHAVEKVTSSKLRVSLVGFYAEI